MKIYAVRNREGKWYRHKASRGYYGGFESNGGEIWRNDVEEATLYSKIGTARARVTYFANHYSEYGVPYIVPFELVEQVAINEELKVKAKIDKKKRKQEEYEILKKKRAVQQAEQELDLIRARIKKLRGE